MSVVAVCFALSIAYSLVSGRQNHHEVLELRRNAAPSIEQLTLVRNDLRRLDAALDAALIAGLSHRPVDRERIAAARSAIDVDFAAYRRLPFYPGERRIADQVPVELARLDASERETLQAIEAGDLVSATDLENGAWRAASDAADDTLRRLIVLNTNQLVSSVERMEDSWRRSAIVEILLGVVDLALAIFATLMAARIIRARHDLQERRIAELELFASRVAHDLLSPLSSVGMALQVTEQRSQDHTVRRLVGLGRSSLGRVRSIIDGLLDFARAGAAPVPGEHAAVDQVLGGVLDELRQQAEECDVELASGPLPSVEIGCSPAVLIVLLSNLVRNAIKHMGDRPIRQVQLRVDDAGDRVRFEVEDTGPGLPPEIEGRAFDLYVHGPTTHGGLGLGLATVQRLVTAHGGSIEVHSSRGRGALFRFELPKFRPAA
jgi:signal transduction histidine kinase